MKKPEHPLVVIAGPTASGKSAAAIEISLKVKGEIICADSRTIYKQTSIGTAKPSAQDRAKVVHHGLNLINLGDSFTAHNFKLYAKKTIKITKSKNKAPISVGGSGLYIDGVIYDFSFRPSSNVKLRSKLNDFTISELHKTINNLSLSMPRNSLNKRHLIRVIETNGFISSKKNLPDDVIYTGLLPSDNVLKANISKRIDSMYQNGFIDEVKTLREHYEYKKISMAGIGYKSALDYLDGKISLAKAKELFKKGDWQLARRQKTWFKRNPDIIWFRTSIELQTHIFRQLNK